jgi:hypothetical protein
MSHSNKNDQSEQRYGRPSKLNSAPSDVGIIGNVVKLFGDIVEYNDDRTICVNVPFKTCS